MRVFSGRHEMDSGVTKHITRSRVIDQGNLLSVLEWLTGDDCHSLDDPGLIAGLGTRLLEIHSNAEQAG